MRIDSAERGKSKISEWEIISRPKPRGLNDKIMGFRYPVSDNELLRKLEGA
jgi:hypothetical protein